MKRLTGKKGEVKAREKVYGDDTYFVVKKKEIRGVNDEKF
jgi:hypothetical protein